MPDEKKDFEVKDKRAFSEDGTAKNTADSAAETDEKKTAGPDSETPGGAGNDQPPLPEINFSTFVISLNASALVHLGQLEDPATGAKSKNLPMAKQTIDILSMLEEKTKGNLSVDEENILKNILYDLRMNYVREKG